ncbi:MAG: RNA methyltransferase [Cyclobacteriaceae bacterium]
MTNKDAKFIKSLQLKKYRNREKAFVIEGEKNIKELLKSHLQVLKLYLTEQFIEASESEIKLPYELVAQKELEKVGSFQSNAFGLAVAAIPEWPKLNLNSGHYLAFENIQDPGNLGTIIRIADWYGFSEIICSSDSVDTYNPKVISATMGSFARVRVYYENLNEMLNDTELPVYGAVLDGNSIHETSFSANGIFLFGNESQGISSELQSLISNKIKIPGYGQAESLNVAIATAVVCDNFRRSV